MSELALWKSVAGIKGDPTYLINKVYDEISSYKFEYDSEINKSNCDDLLNVEIYHGDSLIYLLSLEGIDEILKALMDKEGNWLVGDLTVETYIVNEKYHEYINVPMKKRQLSMDI